MPAPIPLSGPVTRELLAHGMALVLLDRHEDAVPFFSRATSVAPKNPYAWLELIGALRETGQFDEALAACDRASNKCAAVDDAWRLERVRILAKKASRQDEAGQWKDALATLDIAIAIAPEDYTLWRQKGVVLKNWGLFGGSPRRCRQALEALDRALLLHREDQEAQAARDLLAEVLPHVEEERRARRAEWSVLPGGHDPG